MPPSQGVYDILLELASPLIFLLQAASYIPSTIYQLLKRGDVHTITSPSLFKDAWFASFWTVAGPESRINATPRAGPLIALAHGVVLDIGPGSGEWVHLFTKSQIMRIYGVEPNRGHHAALKEKIREAGLEGMYEIVPVGVEELGERWVGTGEVDSVVTVQCLCSVREPREMMGQLWGYLREGGVWIVYEHVVVYGWQGRGMRLYQAAIDIVWPHFLGGCSITRDTAGWLEEAGKWSKVDLYQPEDEALCHVLPHTMGVLTK